jgi:hypothetical protein
MTVRDKQVLMENLCKAALGGILVAQLASVIHLIAAYGWANDRWMAVGLAGVTVLMAGVLLILAVVSPKGVARNSVLGVTALLLVSEFVGNVGAGGLIAQGAVSEDLARFFGVGLGFAQRVATLLFAGVIPIVTFAGIFALSKTAESMLERASPASEDREWLRGLVARFEADSGAGAIAGEGEETE